MERKPQKMKLTIHNLPYGSMAKKGTGAGFQFEAIKAYEALKAPKWQQFVAD